MTLLAVTCGEPAGIGPDLCLLVARRRLPARLVLLADRSLLEARARQLHLSIKLPDFSGDPRRPGGRVTLWHHPLAVPARPGVLDPANSAALLATLDDAAQGCRQGIFDGMVTAPLHKGVINDAGIPFTGHTEYLAARTATPRVVMMLVGGRLRVALATTHLPLKGVVAAITRDSLAATLEILLRELRLRFGIADPGVLVAGLNPHAGEGGHLGREEEEIIRPVVQGLQRQGHRLRGPLPADTLFQPGLLRDWDAVLAMYHDQGLPVLKYASFGKGVNVTLGLPFVRTSVDHGTALDLAGTGQAEAGSLLAAIRLAAQLARRASS